MPNNLFQRAFVSCNIHELDYLYCSSSSPQPRARIYDNSCVGLWKSFERLNWLAETFLIHLVYDSQFSSLKENGPPTMLVHS